MIYRILKRLLDLIVSSLMLIVYLPFGLIISLILKFSGEGEIFYLQQRIGRQGRKFGLIKFATMLKDSPRLKGGYLTTKNDPRILPFGNFLRKTKQNEIPQILNILKGDMSLVGPRPIVEAHFIFYSEQARAEILRIKPGLTGVGSIIFRDEERILHESKQNAVEFYKNEISGYKGELEIWYARNRSFLLDLKLIFLTAWVIIFPRSRLHEKVLKGLPPRPASIGG